MDTQKTVTAADIAKMKKNGKISIAVAVGVLVISILLAMSGNMPAWLLLIAVLSAVLGAKELYKAKKAEAAMQNGATMTPPTPPSEPTV